MLRTCTWTQMPWLEYHPWVTDCANEFEITEGTPDENQMKFCCYCGGRLVQVIEPEPEDE